MHTPLVVILFTIKIEFGQGILKAINSQICQCSLFIPYCIMIHVQILKLLKCGKKYRGSQNYVYVVVNFLS